MRLLIKNGNIIDVVNNSIYQSDVLIEDNNIVEISNCIDSYANQVIDATDKFLSPSFIDSHIHIESSMLNPKEFARLVIRHGTSAVITDPHEIANVCGKDGINYMIDTSKDLPLNIYFTLPSCVPASSNDENGATLHAEDLVEFYNNPQVVGLAEVMDCSAVINEDKDMIKKINDAKSRNKIVSGHAPLLTGEALNKYVSAGIQDDHECTNIDEALEKLELGMKILIRNGSSAKNLVNLIKLFDEPYNKNCLLCSDDISAKDLFTGHVNRTIKLAVDNGVDPIAAIRMATIQAADYYKLKNQGSIEVGKIANIAILDNLSDFNVGTTIFNGEIVYDTDLCPDFQYSNSAKLSNDKILNSFNISHLNAKDFIIEKDCDKPYHIIQAIPNELITKGIYKDTIDDEMAKIAVCERHKNTGHIGLAYIDGLGINHGAIASSVSHDSHNLIICGKNDEDMVLAGNTVINNNGGMCVVKDNEVLMEMKLPIAGLMSDDTAENVAERYDKIHSAALSLGHNEGIEPFMTTSFISLVAIPFLKLTTKGLVEINL